MFSKSRIICVIALFAVVLGACSEYQKVLKSSDLKQKQEAAMKYFNEGKYYKAYPLFEELVSIYIGTSKAEELYYHFAYCEYFLGDYLIASHRFQKFHSTFPNSKYAEECHFMSAYCHYKQSPRSSLDQTTTYQAIDAMQLFINRYPNSSRIDSCNTLIDGLRSKLEIKHFNNAKQYFRTKYYKSAIIAFENMLTEFPDTDYREEVTFLILKSNYLLASNSVPSKKEERFNNTLKAYIKFADKYGKSKYIKEAESMYDNSNLQLAKLKDSNT